MLLLGESHPLVVVENLPNFKQVPSISILYELLRGAQKMKPRVKRFGILGTGSFAHASH